MDSKRNMDTVRIVPACGKNFSRVSLPSELQLLNERPLSLTAWTQTMPEDFQTLAELNHSDHQKREQELLERIRQLESSLKQHSDILAQIQSTAARRDSIVQHETEQQHLVIATAVQQHQQQHQHQQQQHHSTYPPPQSRQTSPSSSTHSSSNTSSVINSVKLVNEHQHKESVKYTIIAEGHSIADDVEGPIEIQLAEETAEGLMNSSADSGRLEICLAEEPDIKSEVTDEHTISQSGDSVAMQKSRSVPDQQQAAMPKRRKISVTADQYKYLQQPQQQSQQSHQYILPKQPIPQPPAPYFNEQNGQSPPSALQTTPKLPTKFNSKKRTQDENQQFQQPQHKSHLHQQHNNNHILNQPQHQSPNGQYAMLKVHSSNNEQKLFQCPTQANGGKLDMDNVMVSIGPNNTRIPAKLYENMNWSSASIATRKLLMTIFGRETLATHSMTGKPSPAFKDHCKPLKQMLEPSIIQDIIFVVTRKCNVSEKEVRNAITTKCADENKMMKLQENKRRLSEINVNNKENVCA